MGYFYSDEELAHHGIKGQKWGVRRFQNKDGTLTKAGVKRYQNSDGSLNEEGKKLISDTYANLATRASKDINEQDNTGNWVKAYNRAADRMNNGLTDQYNKDYDKKLGAKAKGHDYGNDEEYNSGMEKIWSKVFDEEYDAVIKDDLRLNKHYKQAEALVEKYGMLDWDEVAQTNHKYMNS